MNRFASVLIASTVALLALTDAASAAVAFTVAPIVRDFHRTQANFEIIDWNLQTPSAFFANNQSNKIEKGIVGPLGSPLGVNGLPIYSAAREPGFYNTVSTATTFAKWFADVPGENIRVNGIELPFVANGDGSFTYSNSSFFPIDGKGFGAEGFDHNYHFTAHIEKQFTYQPGQNFSIISDDDSWVFINDQLVIDAGGLHGTLGGTVDLSTLALTVGGVYDLDIFFAERNRYGSSLMMTTNIPLPEPTAAALIAPLLLAAAARRRKPGPDRGTGAIPRDCG